MTFVYGWKCPDCGYEIEGEVLLPVHCICTRSERAKKRPPYWFRWLKHLSKPEDKGAGDTIQRLAASLGGEKFKKLTDMIGLPCGCTERQEMLNRLYPYENNSLR